MKLFCSTRRSLIDGDLPRRNKTTVETVINPNPPNWIRKRTINCPQKVNFVPVSTTVNPVTHTAEVAVNKELM